MMSRQITTFDSPEEYLAKLTDAGHVMVRHQQIGGVIYRCDNCNESVRVYRLPALPSGTTMFTDFEEEDQCGRRQMNALTLGVSGTGTSY